MPGVAVLEGADMGEQNAAGGAGGEVHLGADPVGDAGHLLERQGLQVVPLASQGQQAGLLARLAAPPAADWAVRPRTRWGGLAWGGQGRRRGLAAGGDGAFLQSPAS